MWNGIQARGYLWMFVIKVIDKILNKIKEFYLMRVCIKFGGNLMGIWVEKIEGPFCEWSVHPHEWGIGEGTLHGRRPCPLGLPPLPYIRSPSSHFSHTPPREGSLSPLEFIPHGLGLARYMFPVAIRQERVVLPLHRWSEEAEVARCLERVCKHGCAAVLRR